MYSYEERLKAVQLYIQYDKSYASVFRELGYPPSSHSIKLWYKEFEETGGLHKSYSSPSKYSDEQRKTSSVRLSVCSWKKMSLKKQPKS